MEANLKCNNCEIRERKKFMGWIFAESMITMHIHFYVLETLMPNKQRTHGAYSYVVKDKGSTSRHLALDRSNKFCIKV